MRFNIHGKDIQVTPALRQHVEQKVGKIERYFDNVDMIAQVTLSVEKDRHIVEVTVPLGGFILRGEEATGDMYASVDSVIEKLERQIRKYKTRLIRRTRQAAGRRQVEVGAGGFEAEEEGEEGEPRIVRIKRFPLKPMTPEEAVIQMNLVGHDFFVFTNGDTGLVNVVYRRHDGNYGLIEPDA